MIFFCFKTKTNALIIIKLAASAQYLVRLKTSRLNNIMFICGCLNMMRLFVCFFVQQKSYDMINKHFYMICRAGHSNMEGNSKVILLSNTLTEYTRITKHNNQNHTTINYHNHLVRSIQFTKEFTQPSKQPSVIFRRNQPIYI